MPRVDTDINVKMKSEGAGKVAADTQAVGQKATQAMSKVDREVQKLEATFKKLTDRQLELNEHMAGMEDKGSKPYKQLAKNMADVQREAATVERTLKNVERAYRQTDRAAEQAERRRARERREQERQQKEEARRGSFMQGLLQGTIPEAAYLQRGPGMVRQAMGAALGGRVRGGIGGLMQAPFSGVSGLVQAAQSVPLGGLAAMPLAQSMQMAQQALQFRTQRQQMMPFLQMRQQIGSQMVGETATQQRNRIAKWVDQARLEQPVQQEAGGGLPRISGATDIAMLGIVGGIRAYRGIKEAFGGTVGQRLAERRAARDRARKVEAAGGEAAFRRQQEQAEREADIQAMITVEGGPARQKKRAVTLQDMVRRQGRQMGFALPEAMQLMGGVTQAGGGVGQELFTQGLGRVGLAAQRRYGIGPEVTGAFLQAGRTGGAVGAQGRGGAAMVEAIAGGMRMGLEGSELTNWMSQMAGDIRNWQQTGIPINTGSVNALGASMAKMGLGGVRGGAVARGLAGRARELTTRGPQGAEELIMLQELGGLQGMGAEEYQAAQLKLEQGNYDPESVRKMMTRLMASGGGGARGLGVFRRAMRRFGVNIGVGEGMQIQEQLATGKMTPRIKAIQEQMARVGAKAPTNIQDIGEQAIKATDAATKRQAAQTNKQISTGGTMITSMQNLQDSTNAMASAFTTLAKDPIKNLTSSINDLSKSADRYAVRLNAVLKGDVKGAILASGETQ